MRPSLAAQGAGAKARRSPAVHPVAAPELKRDRITLGQVRDPKGPKAMHIQPTAVQAPPPIAAIRPIAPPKPPKVQSDHKPANTATSSRGPAVVLSGGLAKPPERQPPPPPAAGAHVDKRV